MDSEQQCRDFIRWIEALGQAGVVVDNPPEVMAWLLDKRYLLDLDSVGVPIVPTHYAHPGSAALLGQAFSGSLVVKPAISAAGAGLVALEGRTEIEQFQSEFARLNQETAYLIQPLLSEIRTAGEWSLIYLGGQYSHAIHKVPGVGTILCHAERGGSLRFATPPEPVRAVGDALVAKLPQAFTARYPERTGESCFPLLYLRVDIIESAAGALVSECEGVEPELFFRASPGSEKRFADLVEARTGQKAKRG
jgi:glutathione synthase/RimK-type ligase-like ATP-grasp enzyme